MYSIKLQELIDKFELRIITQHADIASKLVTIAEVNRPALQLTGYYDYFKPERLQIIGMVEYTYICKMPSNQRRETFEKLCSYSFPAIILSRKLNPFPELLEAAEAHNIPVLQYRNSTSELMGELVRWLRVKLAPRTTQHGVLLDVFGEGILLLGESGVGKSETALELIHRGHRLVADDSVEIKKVSNQTLVGSCPDIIRYFIELRGIGIIDVKQMFGVESVKDTQTIDLVIQLEFWDKNKEYDRLGATEEYMEILGNKVVCCRIPIRPGRNLAIICESAAINHRQKKMGYNSAHVLTQRVMENINGNSTPQPEPDFDTPGL
ncbi:MAG: HPr(Ser) kinase/phosphatase [Defluviitaleaceae bacterium]|nr:HPr(Ser) kinase/phosphatase [Defluviitaleaceae bacterium]